MMAAEVYYPDFIAAVGFEGETDGAGCFDWHADLRVCPAGIFLQTPPYGMFLSAEERAALPRHPTGDYSQPVLPFPCTAGDLLKLLDEHGLNDCIDPDAPSLRSIQGDNPTAEVSTASDASLGAACRARQSGFAKGNQDMSEARRPEWDRWKATAQEIQGGRTRKQASKRELARLVKSALNLPDSVETIRKHI